jgi:hypothetical protein
VRPGRVRWKPAILAFLHARLETGACRSDIGDYCIGLIKGGTLITAAPADDRPRVDHIVSMYLSAMKRAGEVVRQPGNTYFATARGLAWLKRHAYHAADIRPPDEVDPGHNPEAGVRTVLIGHTHPTKPPAT